MYYPAAMVCEGGALLGVYTAGVLDVLMQKHIYTTYGIGVSVGSCNIVDYSSSQIGRTFKCLNTSDEETIFFGKPAISTTLRCACRVSPTAMSPSTTTTSPPLP